MPLPPTQFAGTPPSPPRPRPVRAALAAVLLLTGCATPPPPDAATGLSPAVTATQTATLTPEEIAAVTGPAADAAYRLGPDDVIAVNVYAHPELTVPAPGVSSSVPGALVTSDGSIQLPLVGSLNIGGLTLTQAQGLIASAYRSYIPNPRISVQLVQAHSFRYYILGEFSEPGVKYPGHALALLPALALGGSVNLGAADLYQAYVARDGKKLPVDLQRLLVQGDMSQNVVLASGDTIVVPSATAETAFVFGTVGKPGPTPFVNGKLTLLQALSGAQMRLADIAQARFKDVRVIRGQGAQAQLMTIDATAILHGQAADVGLLPGDVVYVPATGLASWSQAIDQVLPALEGVSDLLNPFVQIKFLSERTN